MKLRTRFAPSPTGYLHIGGARTALFNYLFAKANGGQFLLRIEDTDQQRSSKAATEAIIRSLKWLDLIHDEEIVYQSQRQARHQEVLQQLLDSGKAYRCYTPQAEINQLRQAAIDAGENFIFRSPWRDIATTDHEPDQPFVIRLKTPHTGQTIVNDLLQGAVTVENYILDDVVLSRADGTPTYMLAVCVDDHDMEITHIIRGDDHLNNAFKQQLIFEAMQWPVPAWVHVPLIHGPDGAKLSKRHGALGVEEYQAMGYLPEALNNYLLRLGWSHGDAEIIDRLQAIKWFNLDGLGKAAARLDFDKMRYINAHYLREMSDASLTEMVLNKLGIDIDSAAKINIQAAIPLLKPRVQLLTELVELAPIYLPDHRLNHTSEAVEVINQITPQLLSKLLYVIENIEPFSKESIQTALKELAAQQACKLNDIMQYVRPLVTGQLNAPSAFATMEIIGKAATINRLLSFKFKG